MVGCFLENKLYWAWGGCSLRSCRKGKRVIWHDLEEVWGHAGREKEWFGMTAAWLAVMPEGEKSDLAWLGGGVRSCRKGKRVNWHDCGVAWGHAGKGKEWFGMTVAWREVMPEGKKSELAWLWRGKGNVNWENRWIRCLPTCAITIAIASNYDKLLFLYILQLRGLYL